MDTFDKIAQMADEAKKRQLPIFITIEIDYLVK